MVRIFATHILANHPTRHDCRAAKSRADFAWDFFAYCAAWQDSFGGARGRRQICRDLQDGAQIGDNAVSSKEAVR
jgi:hypothetical protein